MRRIVLVFSLILVLVLAGSILAKNSTPYHSLNEENYFEVIRALERVEWLTNYCLAKFFYLSDEKQFGYSDYWLSGEEMFYRGKGDCEDWAAFQRDVLKLHNYQVETYGVFSNDSGHAIVIFPYKSGWAYMDCNGDILHSGYKTKEEAINAFYGKRTIFVWKSIPLPTYRYEVVRTPRYGYSDRLTLHAHLTEAKPGFEFYFPAFNYTEALHKQAFGFLVPLRKNSLDLKGIGLSISDHGYYSDSLLTNKRMYSLHLQWPSFGISGYLGDYQGIDLDFNPINYGWLKGYLCLRNLDEVMDYKIKLIPFGSEIVRLIYQKLDRETGYEFHLGIPGSINFGARIYGQKKELVISGEDDKGGLEIVFDFSENKAPEFFKTIRFLIKF